MPSRLKSHQTTIRFSADLWGRLEFAAAALDVSVAQFVRDAARTRLDVEPQDDETPPNTLAEAAGAAQDSAREQLSGSEAVWEQGRLARTRAGQLRGDSVRLRHRLHGGQEPEALPPVSEQPPRLRGGVS